MLLQSIWNLEAHPDERCKSLPLPWLCLKSLSQSIPECSLHDAAHLTAGMVRLTHGGCAGRLAIKCWTSVANQSVQVATAVRENEKPVGAQHRALCSSKRLLASHYSAVRHQLRSAACWTLVLSPCHLHIRRC